ncbi:hypothetical protein CSC62_06610 [Pseudoxanthomonas jiangsuensis]|uniref:hypothetical protein n=1 Tax=Pseudoxanthomonas jiangsuensis TaxID=619688 RepID=UPI0013918895|nr:hypothetical protein [Pseudoxanthomonas jiangsuensis]KAF1698046.1 hypothetical protein CSC62_06610 [Pseudoxanthomonas jiangsuensis]
MIDDNADSPVHAPAYGLLMGHTACHYCQAQTPTVALWVPSYADPEENGPGEGSALLQYISDLDVAAKDFLLGHAHWLRQAHTRTADQHYFAHHCTNCGALQGDHYVFSFGGPYWPQDDAALSRLTYIEGLGTLTAWATAAQSGWMDRVPHVCRRA